MVYLARWSPRDPLAWLYLGLAALLLPCLLFRWPLDLAPNGPVFQAIQLMAALALAVLGLWRLTAARGIQIDAEARQIVHFVHRRPISRLERTLYGAEMLPDAPKVAWLPSPPRLHQLSGYGVRLEHQDRHVPLLRDWPEPRARGLAQELAQLLGTEAIDRAQTQADTPRALLRERLRDTPVAAQAPEPPPASGLACATVDGSLRVELPAHGLSRWGIASIVLGVFLLWTYSVYLFHGGFQAAVNMGSYGSVVFVTVLLAIAPTLLLVLWPLAIARRRELIVLARHYLLLGERGLLGARQTALFLDDIEHADMGPEAFGTGTVIRLLVSGQGYEFGRVMSDLDRKWVLGALLHVLAGNDSEKLANDYAAHPAFVTTALALPTVNATPLAVRLRGRGGQLPLAPAPDLVATQLTVDGETLRAAMPPGGFHAVHAALLGTGALAAFFVGWAGLAFLAPLAAGVFYNATRRHQVELRPDAISVTTRWRLGARTWSAPVDTLTELSVRRSPWNVSSWLRGEGFVLHARTPEGDVEFGHGLSRQELAWLRDHMHRFIATGAPEPHLNALVLSRPPLLGNMLPPRGALTAQEYTAHLLQPLGGHDRFMVLELDEEPRSAELDHAQRKTDLSILGVIALGMIPAGGYAVYLGLFEPGLASLVRLPLGLGLMGAIPGALLATFYRAALIVDRTGGVIMRARTLLLPPALLPRPLLRRAARQAALVPLEGLRAVVVSEMQDASGDRYYAVWFDGPQRIVAKQLRAPEAARYYARRLSAFTQLPLRDELAGDPMQEDAAGQ